MRNKKGKKEWCDDLGKDKVLVNRLDKSNQQLCFTILQQLKIEREIIEVIVRRNDNGY